MLADFEDRTRRLSIVAGLSAVRDPGMGGVGGLTAVPVNPADSVESGLSEAGRRGALLSSRLKLVEKKLFLQADQLALTPSIVPAAGVLTAGFGARPDPFTNHSEFHTGIDISTPAGNRVIAPASGTVVRVGWDKGYGRFVEIAHGYGVTTLYGHLQAARVAEGQRVKRGDLVALVGSTGRSTGPHLHYEVHTRRQAGESARLRSERVLTASPSERGNAASLFSGNPRPGSPNPSTPAKIRSPSALGRGPSFHDHRQGTLQSLRDQARARHQGDEAARRGHQRARARDQGALRRRGSARASPRSARASRRA